MVEDSLHRPVSKEAFLRKREIKKHRRLCLHTIQAVVQKSSQGRSRMDLMCPAPSSHGDPVFAPESRGRTRVHEPPELLKGVLHCFCHDIYARWTGTSQNDKEEAHGVSRGRNPTSPLLSGAARLFRLSGRSCPPLKRGENADGAELDIPPSEEELADEQQNHEEREQDSSVGEVVRAVDENRRRLVVVRRTDVLNPLEIARAADD